VRLKEALVSAPVLAMPIDGGGYVLDTDACKLLNGMCITAVANGELKVIGYAGRAFSDAELRYCTTHRELAAIIFGLKYYRHFLLGYKFVLRTDHAALTYLMKMPNPVGQSARYLSTLAEYNFSIQYRPGDSHHNADALSRRPCGRDRMAPVCQQCGPMLDPIDETPELQEMAVESEMQGEKKEAERLRLGLDVIKEDSVLEPSLAKITLRIPGLDSGMSDEDASSGAEAELKNTSLQARKTRKSAAAHLPDEIAQPRVDLSSPPISPESERDKAVGLIDVQSEIATSVDLIELQKQDMILGVIQAWLENPDMIPDKNTLRTFEPEFQQMWVQRDSLEITRGILYRRYARPDGSLLYLQIVVPQVLRTAFLDAVHAGAISGHPGIERTRERLQEIAYWKG